MNSSTLYCHRGSTGWRFPRLQAHRKWDSARDHTDLSSLNGPTSSWIYDDVFREIDITTDDLVFEWQAFERYQIDESFVPLDNTGRTRDEPYDFFHINSVDKDPDRNYYISSRHMYTVTCLRPSGDILWILGGLRQRN